MTHARRRMLPPVPSAVITAAGAILVAAAGVASPRAEGAGAATTRPATTAAATPAATTRATTTAAATPAADTVPAAAAFATDEEPRLRPGQLIAAMGDLDEPVAVLMLPGGEVVVAEAAGGRLRVYDPPSVPDPLPPAPTANEILDPGRTVVPPPSLRLNRVVGRPLDRGNERERTAERFDIALERPVSLARFGAGRLAVGDSAARTVWLIDDAGGHERLTDRPGFIAAFPGSGGEIQGPHGLATNGSQLAVTESVTGRVLVMRVGDADIDQAAAIDPSPPLRRPVGLSFTGDGALLVADADAPRIRRFIRAADGAWTEGPGFGDYGPFPGFYEEPADVDAVDGGVLVTDVRTHRLQWHGDDGTFIEAWGIHARRPHEAGGVIHYPADVALDPAGRCLVLAEPREMRVQIFARNPQPFDPNLRVVPPAIPRDAHFGPRIGLGRDLLVLAEPDAHRVHLFDVRRSVPIVVGSFGERGRGNGLLLRTTGLLLNETEGIIDLVDAAKARLQRLRLRWEPGEPTGFKPERFRFARFVPFAAIAHGREGAGGVAVPGLGFGGPVALRPGPDGRRLLVDPLGDRIIVLDDQLQPVLNTDGRPMVWGGRGTELGQFRRPTDTARSADDEAVYVVDADNHRVQILSAADGRPRSAFGTRGTGDGAFLDPFGVAVGPDGRVYVTDRGRHDVQVFDASGGFLTRFGQRGAEQEDLWRPGGIAVHADGRIFVVDEGNHRAKVFDADGQWQLTFGTGRAVTRERRDAGRERERERPRRAGEERP
ncbi:MAG: hypothetical protein AB8G96_14940 [Phycisphaerales bacterium]